MSGEIAKTLRAKLWSLKFRSRDDVNKHINDFMLYMDQLRELAREEREETLTDLFLDSIVDPKFEVTIANCRLRDQITIHECFEADRKYDNIISRGMVAGEDGNRNRIRRLLNNNTKKTNGEDEDIKVDDKYRTYSEWQKLTPKQRSEILEAREKRNKDEISSEVQEKNQEQGKQHQRGRKRTRRTPIVEEKEEINTGTEEQS
jgi:hypothetical protein